MSLVNTNPLFRLNDLSGTETGATTREPGSAPEDNAGEVGTSLVGRIPAMALLNLGRVLEVVDYTLGESVALLDAAQANNEGGFNHRR